MNDNMLYEEIINDPLNMGYKDAKTKVWKDDAEVARLLNAELLPKQNPVQLSMVLDYIFRRGLWSVIDELAHDDREVKKHSIAARTLFGLLYNPHLKEFDLASPAFTQIIDTLIHAKVFKDTHKQELLSMGITKVSRGMNLGIGRVNYYDVGRVRIHGKGGE